MNYRIKQGDPNTLVVLVGATPTDVTYNNYSDGEIGIHCRLRIYCESVRVQVSVGVLNNRLR